MFKLFLLACMMALVAGEPKPDPNVYYSAYPSAVAGAYAWPAAYTASVAAAPVPYSAFTAPGAAYSAYTAPVAAYSAYSYATPYSYYFRR